MPRPENCELFVNVCCELELLPRSSVALSVEQHRTLDKPADGTDLGRDWVLGITHRMLHIPKVSDRVTEMD